MHSLTEKIRARDIKSDRWDDLDSIITDSLKKMAEKLQDDHNKGKDFVPFEIMGLSEEPKGVLPCGCTGICIAYHPVQESKEWEWCEHLTQGKEGYMFQGLSDGKRFGYFMNTDSWKQCPVCFAKRPEKKSLKEILKDRIDHILSGYATRINEQCYSMYRNIPQVNIGLSREESLEKLVGICLEFLNSKKEGDK